MKKKNLSFVKMLCINSDVK